MRPVPAYKPLADTNIRILWDDGKVEIKPIDSRGVVIFDIHRPGGYLSVSAEGMSKFEIDLDEPMFPYTDDTNFYWGFLSFKFMLGDITE